MEKKGEVVAQFKSTIAVLSNMTLVLAGDVPFQAERFQPEKSVQSEELKTHLAQGLWKKAKKGSKPAQEKK